MQLFITKQIALRPSRINENKNSDEKWNKLIASAELLIPNCFGGYWTYETYWTGLMHQKHNG